MDHLQKITVAEKTSTLLSWLILVLFIVVFINMSVTPRIPIESPERVSLRSFHMAIASILFAFSFLRVYIWWQFPPQNKQQKLPQEAYNQLHVLQFTLYCTLITQGLTGLITTWSDGLMQFQSNSESVNHALWIFSGYLHSAFAFLYIAIIVFIVLIGIYHMIRYRVWRFSIFI